MATVYIEKMRCPFCNADKESLKVLDSRSCEGGRGIRRRRQCQACNRRFTTYEYIEENTKLQVVKKDGSRAPYDRSKILKGLQTACYKRPIPSDAIDKLIDEVEEEIYRLHDREVPTSTIGQLVTERLRALDQVAYVRFASVYREFRTLDDLVREANAVINLTKDIPGQGKLFGEGGKKE